MPILTLATHQLHYEIEGPEHAPVLLFAHALGTNMDMWTFQIKHSQERFRVLRIDVRGHGGSSAPPGPYRIEDLGQDVLVLLDHLKIERAHFCGLSMGGMIGQWLAVHAPARLGKLIVSNSAARVGSHAALLARADLVRCGGMKEVSCAAAERWFTSTFLSRKPGTVNLLVRQLQACSQEGYANCCETLAVTDLRKLISRITLPPLVISGRHDPVTTLSDAVQIIERVRGSNCVELPASHLSNIEAASAFNQTLLQFLAA
jgi:3-oxoadipate enol-lactonase